MFYFSKRKCYIFWVYIVHSKSKCVCQGYIPGKYLKQWKIIPIWENDMRTLWTILEAIARDCSSEDCQSAPCEPNATQSWYQLFTIFVKKKSFVGWQSNCIWLYAVVRCGMLSYAIVRFLQRRNLLLTGKVIVSCLTLS